MNVLHLAKTFVAGVPIRLTHFLNKYSKGEIRAKCILDKPSSIKFLDNQNIIWYNKNKSFLPQLDELLKWADIIHIHNYPPFIQDNPGWNSIKTKPIILHFHSEPERVQGLYDNIVSTRCIKLAKIICIAQYQAIFIPIPNTPVRNVIDINDHLLMPIYKVHKKPLITYSPTRTQTLEQIKAGPNGIWSYKSYTEITQLFKKFGDEQKLIDYKIITNTPYEEHLKIRQNANIHIDEISSGSYHLSSLEGLSQGKIVIANIKSWMYKFLMKFIGSEYLPWYNADVNTIDSLLIELLNNQSELIERQKESRKWMEDYWNPDLVLEDYMNIYRGL